MSEPLNPFFRALFIHKDPGPQLKQLRISLTRDTTRFLLLVPPPELLWAWDSDTKQPFTEALCTDEYVCSHALFIPGDFRSSEKARVMNTYNNKKVFFGRQFAQIGQRKCIIGKEYVVKWKEGMTLLCCDLSWPMVGTPVFHDLQTGDSEDTTMSISDLSLMNPPEFIGVDLAKIKKDIHKLRDFKLLPVVYGSELSRLDYEFTILINQFYCDSARTKDDLIRIYNSVIDTATAKFQDLGQTIVNKIASETDLTGDELASMIGQHIENQIHKQLWDKTTELCADEDAITGEHCWRLKDISIEQVGLPVKSMQALFDLDELVEEAVKLFSSIGSVPGIQNKTKVLLTVMQLLSGGVPTHEPNECEALQRVSKCSVHYNAELNNDPNYSNLKNNISADVLLSLMLLVVIRSNIICIRSTLFYIQNFSFEDVNLGQLGYALSTLEAVLFHLSDPNNNMIELSQHNKDLWSNVKLKSTSEMKLYIDELPDKAIINTRSANFGMTLLMHYLMEKDNEMFDFLISKYSIELILADRDSLGSTLFVNALDTENTHCIETLFEILISFPKDKQHKYLNRVNNLRRSAAHYIYNAFELLSSIGEQFQWDIHDHSGQTPLFAVCRCYDHPQYQSMVTSAFRCAVSNVNVGDQLDGKDNSLLHVVKHPAAIKQLLEMKDIDVNWPNDAGFSPLMYHSKFSHVESVLALLEDNRVELLGLPGALEVARDLDTIKALEFSTAAATKQKTGIVRTTFQNGVLQFVIRTNDVAVRRTVDDFRFLEEWLAYENPYSWVPTLSKLFNPKYFRGQIVYQLFKEIQIHLDTFLNVLVSHPTYKSHELVWEFLLVQDISRDSVIERCRRKLENVREERLDLNAPVYSQPELDAVKVFFEHALAEISKLSHATHEVYEASLKQTRTLQDYDRAITMLLDTAIALPGVPTTLMPAQQKAVRLGLAQPVIHHELLGCSLSALCYTIDGLVATIQRPLTTLAQLAELQTQLSNSRVALEKLTGKPGLQIWPNGYFADKKRRDAQDVRDKLYITQNEIGRLNSDVRYMHSTLASELGSVYGVQEGLMRGVIQSFAERMVKVEKGSLERLQRLKATQYVNKK